MMFLNYFTAHTNDVPKTHSAAILAEHFAIFLAQKFAICSHLLLFIEIFPHSPVSWNVYKSKEIKFAQIVCF